MKILRTFKGLFGLLLASIFAPQILCAQLGTGPQSVMGLGSNIKSQFLITDDTSRLSIARLESPYPLSSDDEEIHIPAFNLDYIHAGNATSYYLSLTNKNDDIHGIAGFSFDRFKFASLYGNSDGIISARQELNGVAPNFFHGAVSYDYEYTGAMLGLSLTDELMIHGGSNFIRSAGLEDRSVYFSGFSFKKFYTTFSSVNRSDETVGYSLVYGFDLERYDFSYQELISRYGATWREATIDFLATDNLSRMRLSFGRGNNDLHQAGEETRVALMFSIPLGGDSKRLNRSGSAKGLGSNRFSSTNSFHKLRNAGIGAVGSGVALSSGSADLDRTPRFKSQHRAAYFVLSNFNPISVLQNREYGSSVYRNRDKTFSPNRFVSIGNHDSVLITPYANIPIGTRPTAIWHTHGAYKPRYANEQFSAADIRAAINLKMDGYLGTPLGRMKYFDLDSRVIYTFVNETGSNEILPH
ncbi:MAG: DUF4329 domain-containing protein [Deltaproteobacteria bacterium]|nr:DUF4329 domain-containing protein [Deltaproteobacteria bacterium]